MMRDDTREKAKSYIHENLLQTIDLRRADYAKLRGDVLREKVSATVCSCLSSFQGGTSLDTDPGFVSEIVDELVGLGPLELFLRDPTVTEIMVNGPSQIFVEREGQIQQTSSSFVSEASLRNIIARVVSPLGRRIDESSPMVDARLSDGSRVNAIIPPLSLSGPTVTIRKFSKTPLSVSRLLELGAVSDNAAHFLDLAVTCRRNILIAGGTGSGKTTLLNALSGFIPPNERIITIEDAAELKLPQKHVVSLEARPPNVEGRGEIAIRDLVRNALRMRPDRIVVGECRGGEALDMLQAMNTGHDGSMTTAHANSPRDALLRLETMVLMAGFDLPLRAIREQISSAVHLIVFVARFGSGERGITHITEICGTEEGTIQSHDLFRRAPGEKSLESTRRIPRFADGISPERRSDFVRLLSAQGPKNAHR